VATFSAESPNLADEGPIITVTIGLTRAAQAALQKDKKPVPVPVTASALIDTGASGSVVQQGLLGPLGLHPVGQTAVSTPTSQGVSCALYAVQLTIPNGYLDITVIEAPLQGQNIEVLIGRDVLKHGVFFYNGHSSQFTLSF
jgi:predicted aspartyl protease